MRLRTTAAAVFVGAVALVLPTAGPSPADDQGGGPLGTLHYRFFEQDGDERRAQIRPAGNDTCYLLTHTSRNEPAVEVVNQTRSQAVLFGNQGCSGRAERVLAPGQRVRDVEVVAVFFRPADGRGDGRGDGGGDGGDGGGDGGGRGDQGIGDQGGADPGRGDQGRGDQGRGDQGIGDQGGGDLGGADPGSADQGRGDQGIGDQGSGGGAREDLDGNGGQGGRGETGRGDNVADTGEEGAVGEEDFLTRIFRSIG
ncbi:hypothetical protein [Streptomyces sp. NBC_01408]|uniref:hypothetical protein n=1 Tax=Streptomyces sp. NBC_01408 TaxID=2903855 RepID=UPI002255F769|nr:hypothetical protein [Streptomyces sp. NBC_01408]MCX4690912.1 hypothetical protein [Streptomyces sp. NBC_01408]